MRGLLDAIGKVLAARKDLEPAPTPARLTALTAASYSLEVFCYVLTSEINDFFKIQGELLMEINRIFAEAKVELA